jgi:hypothetical protein
MSATTPAMPLERPRTNSVEKTPANEEIDFTCIDSSFISLPISAIVEVTQTTSPIHDLLDSYHTLHFRLNTLINYRIIESMHLQGLKQYGAAFIEALRRDILPVIQDPSSLLASNVDMLTITSHYRRLEEAVSLSHIALQCSALILYHQCLSSLLSGMLTFCFNLE